MGSIVIERLERETSVTAAFVNGISTSPCPAKRGFQDVSAAEILDCSHPADHRAGIIADVKPDQIGMIEFLIFEIGGQGGAVDE